MTHRPRYTWALILIGAAAIGVGIGLMSHAGQVTVDARRSSIECNTAAYSTVLEGGDDTSADCPTIGDAGAGWQHAGVGLVIGGMIVAVVGLVVPSVRRCPGCLSDVRAGALVCPHCSSPQ